MKKTLNLLKINHYIKNIVIFLPLVFMGKLKDIELLLSNLKVFIAFCFISSAVYIFNDIKDIEFDKKHPLKRFRPIASGQISLKQSKIIITILLILELAVSFILKCGANICILGYFLLNIVYSLKLKRYKYIDMICIAIGFVFRLLAGMITINVPISVLMIIMVFITSIFFTSSKRELEFKLLETPSQRRFSMQNIGNKTLNKILYASAILSILSYTFLTIACSKAVPHLYITVLPFVLFIIRILFLINDTNNHDDPMKFMEKDEQIKALFFIFFVLLIGLTFF